MPSDAPPSQEELDVAGRTATRVQQVSPVLTRTAPDAAFGLVATPMADHRLSWLSQGLLDFVLRNPGIQTTTSTQMGINVGALAEAIRLDPSLAGLPPEAQWLGLYLRRRSQGQSGIMPYGTQEETDPLMLANLVLDIQQPTGLFKHKVILRSSLRDMLAKGEVLATKGYESLVEAVGTEAFERGERPAIPGKSNIPPELADRLEQAIKPPTTGEAYRAQAISQLPSAEGIVRNYFRALTTLQTIQTLYPDAEITFQDGGVVGRTVEGYMDIARLLGIPSGFVIRNLAAAGRAITPDFAIGGWGKREPGEPPAKPSFASPLTVARESLNSNGYGFGEQARLGMGMKATDPGAATVEGLVDFIFGWSLDPMAVLGKGTAAVKLAKTRPLIPGGTMPKGDVGRLYQLIGKSPAEWVTSSAADDVFRGIQRLKSTAGPKAESVIRDYFGLEADIVADLTKAANLDEFRVMMLDKFEGFALNSKAIGRAQGQLDTLTTKLAEMKAAGLEGTMEWGQAVAQQRLLFKRLSSVGRKDVTILSAYPRRSFARAVREQVSMDVAEGRLSRETGRMLEVLSELHVPGTRPRISRFWQNIPKDEWRNPWSLDARPGELDMTAAALDTSLRDFGVAAGKRKEIVSSLIKAEGPDEWFRIITGDAKAAMDEAASRIRDIGLPKAGSRYQTKAGVQVRTIADDGSPHVARSIVQFFDTAGEGVFGVVPYTDELGHIRWKHTLAKMVESDHGLIPKGRPSKYTELKQRLLPPSHTLALETTGFWRRFAQHRGWGNFWRGDKEMAARGLQGAEDAITAAWRDSILLPRFMAVNTRIQIEQMARIAAFGKASAYNRPLEWIKWLFATGDDRPFLRQLAGLQPGERLTGAHMNRVIDDLDDMLGSIAHQMQATGHVAPVSKVLTYAGAAPKEQAAFVNAVREGLKHHFDDPWGGMRQLARRGVDDWVDNWAKTPEGEAYVSQMRQIIDETAPAGVDPVRHFAQQNWDEQQNLLQGNDNLKAAIIRGYAMDDEVALAAESVKDLRDWQAEVVADAEQSLEQGFLSGANDLYSQANQIGYEIKRQLRAAGAPEEQLAKIKITGEELVPLGGRHFMPAELSRASRVSLASEDFNTYLSKLIERRQYKPPAYVGGFLDEPVAGLGKVRRLRNFMYRNFLSRPDSFLSRRPLWRQFNDERMKDLLALGVPKRAATRQAGFYAARQTSDLLYDLSQRTSAQAFFRHIAPFFPAWQEVMTTWMWKIPSRYGAGIGHAMLAQRVNQLKEGFETLGIDPTKDVRAPLLGFLFNAGYGGPELVPEFNVQDLSMFTTSYWPGLGPMHAAGLGLASKHLSGSVDTLAEMLMPFGLDVQFGPASVNRGYEAICLMMSSGEEIAAGRSCSPPWELASPELQDLRFSFSLTDSARQIWYEWNKEGKGPPKEEDFDSGESWRRANDEWAEGYFDAVRRRAVGFFATRSLVGLWYPAAPYVADEIKREVSTFYEALEGAAKSSPGAQALYDQFYADHEFADLYLTPASIKDRTLAADAADDRYQQILDDQAKKLSVEDFVALGQGLASRRLFERRFEADLAEVGSTPPAVLTNWFQRFEVLSERTAAWNRYLGYNKNFARLWSDLLEGGKDDLPDTTWRTEKLRHMADLALDFANDPLIAEAIPGMSFRTLRAQLYEVMNVTYGPAEGPMQEGLDWWFDNVFGEVDQKLDRIRERAGKAKTKDERGAILDEIRRVLDGQQPKIGPDGLPYPTVELFWWGNRPERNEDATSPADVTQEELRLKWLLRKPEWLTEFQRGKVGYGGGKDVSEFFDYVNDANRALRTLVDRRNISTSSYEYDGLQADLDRAVQNKARELGVDPRFLVLTDQAPYQRMRAYGFYVNSPEMHQLFTVADQMTQDFIDHDVSPKGMSLYTEPRKEALFRAIDDMRKRNGLFDEAWLEIQAGLGSKDSAIVPHSAYDAILFNNFWNL